MKLNKQSSETAALRGLITATFQKTSCVSESVVFLEMLLCLDLQGHRRVKMDLNIQEHKEQQDSKPFQFSGET